MSVGNYLHNLCKAFPGFAFTYGQNNERKFCVFVHRFVERGTNIPSGNPICEIETGHGYDEFDKELMQTKLMMVCG